MMSLMYKLFLNIFVFILIGAVLGIHIDKNWDKLTKKAIWWILYVLVPFFVLSNMWTSPMSFISAWKVILVALIVIVVTSFAAFLWARTNKVPFRHYCLPIVFMNSSYLAIPVNSLFWGQEGVTLAIIYSITVTMIHFTFGVWWVSEEKPLAKVLELPVIYAVVIGILFNVIGFKAPDVVVDTINYISKITLAVMLVFVGYRLAKIKINVFKDVLIGVFLRMGLGWLIAIVLIRLFDLSWPAAGVCIVTSSMPAAVNSYIIAEKFNADSEFAADTLFVGTILALFTIPLIGYFYVN